MVLISQMNPFRKVGEDNSSLQNPYFVPFHQIFRYFDYVQYEIHSSYLHFLTTKNTKYKKISVIVRLTTLSRAF